MEQKQDTKPLVQRIKLPKTISELRSLCRKAKVAGKPYAWRQE